MKYRSERETKKYVPMLLTIMFLNSCSVLFMSEPEPEMQWDEISTSNCTESNVAPGFDTGIAIYQIIAGVIQLGFGVPTAVLEIAIGGGLAASANSGFEDAEQCKRLKTYLVEKRHNNKKELEAKVETKDMSSEERLKELEIQKLKLELELEKERSKSKLSH